MCDSGTWRHQVIFATEGNCDISGNAISVNDVLVLQGCYAEQFGGILPDVSGKHVCHFFEVEQSKLDPLRRYLQVVSKYF